MHERLNTRKGVIKTRELFLATSELECKDMPTTERAAKDVRHMEGEANKS